MSSPRVGRGVRIGVVLVLAFAFVYVAKPFSVEPSSRYVSGSSRISLAPAGESSGPVAFTVVVRSAECGPALFDAWHSQPPQSGWFGYAPLTETSIAVAGSCRLASQHRIRMAALGVLFGMTVLFSVWVIDRRRRDEPGPAPDPEI